MRLEVNWDWQKGYDAREMGRRALYAAGLDLLRRANQQVPIDTGTLRDSGHVDQKGPFVFVAYDAWYATIVHERLNVRHRTGRAKWLELALLESKTGIATTIQKGIKL